MTTKEFNTRVAEIETALETNESGQLIVSIGRAKDFNLLNHFYLNQFNSKQ